MQLRFLLDNSCLYKLRGIFGTPRATFAMVEVQGRDGLHLHLLYWSGLSPDLMQATTGVHIELTSDEPRGSDVSMEGTGCGIPMSPFLHLTATPDHADCLQQADFAPCSGP